MLTICFSPDDNAFKCKVLFVWRLITCTSTVSLSKINFFSLFSLPRYEFTTFIKSSIIWSELLFSWYISISWFRCISSCSYWGLFISPLSIRLTILFSVSVFDFPTRANATLIVLICSFSIFLWLFFMPIFTSWSRCRALILEYASNVASRISFVILFNRFSTSSRPK